MKLITKIKNWLYPVPKPFAEPDPKKFFSKIEITGWTQIIEPERYERVTVEKQGLYFMFPGRIVPYTYKTEEWKRIPAKTVVKRKEYNNPSIDMTKSV